MKLLNQKLLTTLGVSILLTSTSAVMAQNMPKNIRLVTGSASTGGDTYQNASILAEALAAKLDVNIKVDAVGASQAFKVLSRDKRGTTIMFHHDQSYLAYLYGVQGSYNIFDSFIIGPTISINPGNAYLLPKNSPYNTMKDVLDAAANGTQVRVAIQPGGVSEIGFTAMKNAAKLNSAGSEANLVPVNTGDQADKNQAMWDKLADVINGSIQANEQYTQLPADDVKAMRFLWLTSSKETLEQADEKGYGDTTRDDLLKYATPQTSVTFDGSRDFTLDKEFFLIYNKDMDPAMMDAIDKALTEIYAEGKIQANFKKAFFIPSFNPRTEGSAKIKAKNDDYEKIIKELKGK